MWGPCLQSLPAPLEEDHAPAAASAGRVPVLLPVALDQTYDYLLPDGLEARPGSFVLVPFGPQQRIGVVWDAPFGEAGKPVADKKLKVITATLADVAIAERRLPVPNPAHCKVQFSDAQALAVHTMRAAADAQSFSVTLLDGVTGSGKTEVYFEAVARTLERGRQALIMLPEIALTSQFMDRFTARFGCAPVEWHSALSPGERARAWRAAANGEARVVVGARSALFLPYRDLGLIVVDEEHDGGFKQEDR